MNEFELHKELERNSNDKQIIKDELCASQKKWAEYVLKHKDEIHSQHHPIIVKKKKSAFFKEVLNKIKAIFGMVNHKNNNNQNGTETYLHYRNEFEEHI